MSTTALVLVLLAALFHALWNALVNAADDPLVSVAGVSIGCAFAALFVIPMAGFPVAEVWLWIGLSVCIHTAYMLILSRAYREADFSAAYPVSRGLAPAIVTLVSLFALSISMTASQLVAIAVILSGIVLVASARWRRSSVDGSSIKFALLTAVLIAVYTLFDGMAVTRHQNPLQFVSWTISLQSIPITLWVWRRRGQALWSGLRSHAGQFLLGGAFSYAAYAIVLWAMTVAPIPLVAALRETSIVFAALIAWFWMKEPGNWQRLAAVALIFCGVVLLRLA